MNPVRFLCSEVDTEMIRISNLEDVQIDFLCTLSESLSGDTISRNRLAALWIHCPAELRDQWIANAKVVLLLNRIWPSPRRPL